MEDKRVLTSALIKWKEMKEGRIKNMMKDKTAISEEKCVKLYTS